MSPWLSIFLSCSLHTSFCLFFQQLDILSEELPEHCANLQQCNWTKGKYGQSSCVQTHTVAPEPAFPASRRQQTSCLGVAELVALGPSDLETKDEMSLQSSAMTESGTGPSSNSAGE
ncbi:coiled-coil domain-containing protein 129 [Sigmodon hispidus]